MMRRFSISSPFYTKLGKLFLVLAGWKTQVNLPNLPKQIIVFAPHTSNWDFFFLLTGFYSVGIRPNWIGKKELFFWPLGKIFKAVGGIPIDRSGNLSVVSYIANEIKKREKIVIGIAPEGTRKKTDYWKTGFYHIANEANVHISFTYLDHKNKVVGIEPGFNPSGDIEEDFKSIRKFFEKQQGKYPHKTGKIQIRPKHDNQIKNP